MIRKSLIVATLVMSAGVAQASSKSFTCPVDTGDAKEMYEGMPTNMVRGREHSGIVFVDEVDQLKDASGKLTGIGQTFVPEGETEPDFKGTFKINYDYKAKECRRQIVIQGQNADPAGGLLAGSFNGETRIEICSPNIMKIFAFANKTALDKGVKSEDLDFMTHIFPVIKGQAEKMLADAKPLRDQVD
ncbi:MAG: hypothetical protein AAF203_07980, partial [Pseudomonadota bacterium]